jgi:hypothetical protein
LRPINTGSKLELLVDLYGRQILIGIVHREQAQKHGDPKHRKT